MSERRLTFDRLATTEDSGDPVVQGELPDTGSFVNVVIPEDRELVRVTHVQSNRRGDMRRLLDAVTRQLETTHVRFMVPLGEEMGSDLHAKLDGFEEQSETVMDPEGGTTDVPVLDGEWDYTRRAEND